MKKIFIHIGLVLILSGFSLIFIEKVSASIDNYYNDIDKSNKIIDTVEKDYSEFKEKALSIKKSIVDVSKMFNIYLNEFKEKNVDILKNVNIVESRINEISDISLNIVNNCKYDLNSKKMEKNCESFKINYLNMIDSYNKMIEVYNKVIGEYNNYQIKKGLEPIDKYELKISSSILSLYKSIDE